MHNDVITIVSGLPRSGTSMMMKMLDAGGMQILTDNLRTADEDNPRGYYEFERVKQIRHDKSWLPGAKGKVVKIISEFLKHLPPDYRYRVIFMRRKIEEVLASQRQMLIRRGGPTGQVSDEKMAELFRRHLLRVDAMLKELPNVEVLYVDFHEILSDPAEQAKKVNQFLDNSLNVEAMISVVAPSLYRQRL